MRNSSAVSGFRTALKTVLPEPAWVFLRNALYRRLGKYAGESHKAENRRRGEGFFQKYCRGKGLDIGCGGDKLTNSCDGWDMEHGDAQYLKGLPDAAYDFVYASHILEHMRDPAVALQNWWRVVKPGGHLLLYIPHRDLYEKKKELPSNWNPDHKHFFLPDRDEPPCTIGVTPLVERALGPVPVVYIKSCSDGHTVTDPNQHSDGEYSIEMVIRKKAR